MRSAEELFDIKTMQFAEEKGKTSGTGSLTH